MFVFFQIIVDILAELISFGSFVFFGFVWMVDNCSYKFMKDF